jgi:hypothetical protein
MAEKGKKQIIKVSRRNSTNKKTQTPQTNTNKDALTNTIITNKQVTPIK